MKKVLAILLAIAMIAAVRCKCEELDEETNVSSGEL